MQDNDGNSALSIADVLHLDDLLRSWWCLFPRFIDPDTPRKAMNALYRTFCEAGYVSPALYSFDVVVNEDRVALLRTSYPVDGVSLISYS